MDNLASVSEGSVANEASVRVAIAGQRRVPGGVAAQPRIEGNGILYRVTVLGGPAKARLLVRFRQVQNTDQCW
jgi:hypothetical protein